MTSSAPAQSSEDVSDPRTAADPVNVEPGPSVIRAAAVVAAVGLAIELVAAARVGPFDTAYLVGGEVLLTSIGLVVGTGWRRRRHLAAWWSDRLAALWLLLAFTAFYAALMATGVEIGPLRTSVLASMVLATNWWLVVAPQVSLAAPSPLVALWLPAVAIQATAVGTVAVSLRRRRQRRHVGATGEAGGTDDAARASGLPPGAVVALVGGLLVTLWTAVLANLAAASAPGRSPLGDPGTLPSALVRLLNIDGTYDATRIAYGTDTRMAGFLFGVCVAYVLPTFADRLTRQARAAIALAAVVVVAVLAFVVPIGWTLSGGLGVAGAAAALLGLCAGGTMPERFQPVIAPVVWLGSRSWSIYVWILPVAILSTSARSGLDGALAGGLALVLPVLIGAGAAELVEPFLRRWTAPSGRPKAGLRIVCAYWLALLVLGASVIRAGPGMDVYQATVDDGRYPVLFAGDSMPYGLGLVTSGRGLDAEVGLAAGLAALPGCGITTGAIVNGSSVSERLPECDELLGYMDTETRGTDPVAAILLVWAWELYDHRVTEDDVTTTYEVGTPEWRERFGSVAQDAIDRLSQEGAVVVLVTMPCVDPDAETPNHPTSVAATEPERLVAVNDMVRQLADWNRSTAVLVDLNGEYLCPDGDYRAHIDGVLMSDDSVHFTEDGAAKIWVDYLGPRVQELLGVTEAGGVDGGDA